MKTRKNEPSKERVMDLTGVPAGLRHTFYSPARVHSFEADGSRYIWDPNNRSASELPPPVSDLLALIPAAGCSFEELYRLSDGSYSARELARVLSDLEQAGMIQAHTRQLKPFSSLNLLLTTHCNLNCLYCYGGNGREDDLPGGSYSLPQKNMPPEIGFAAVDYLLKTAAQRPDGNPGGITFFGGEPLLNLETIQAILHYGEDQAVKFGTKPPRYSITTNGVAIPAGFLRLCKRYDITVQVSFDGTKEVQDSLRPVRGEGSSYDACCASFQTLKDNDIPFRIRATITRRNLQLLETVQHLEPFGVSHVHFALANTGSDGSGLSLKEEDIQTLVDQYRQVGDYMLGSALEDRPFVRCGNIIAAAQSQQKASKKTYCCGAGMGLASVTPDGDMALCHRFAGEEPFSVGHIQNGIDFEARYRFIQDMHIATHQECTDCWCKDLCGGGCPYTNYLYGSQLYTPNSLECTLQKGLAEIGIHFAACLRKANEDLYWKVVGE